MGRGSKSKKKFSGRELHRQIKSGGGPEVGISAIINNSIMFIYCKKHMFVSLNFMSFLSVALPVMHLAIQNSSISYMMLEALCVGLNAETGTTNRLCLCNFKTSSGIKNLQ